MQVYDGVNALSDFRAKRLLKELRILDPNISSLTAEYLHFIDVDNELSQHEVQELKKLLAYGSPFDGQRNGTLFLVTPRPGTISPWSSKATDIAHNAGLSQITRIERGVAYYIDSAKRSEIAPLLHDRMTESVFETAEAAEALFHQPKPKPLILIDIQKGGRAALEKANNEQGLALSPDEIDYLVDAYTELGRNPSAVSYTHLTLPTSDLV